jgi:Peptidase MA superfamily
MRRTLLFLGTVSLLAGFNTCFGQWLSDEEVYSNVFKSGTLEFISIDKNQLRFHFQPNSYSLRNKKTLIDHALAAVEDNSQLLNAAATDTMDIVFLNSREQMQQLTKSKAKGWALPSHSCVLLVVNDSTRPYLRHELMHLMSVNVLGPSTKISFWMNEGLSVYAEGTCVSHSLDELGAFFLYKNLFISIDTLETNFWGSPDMLAYMESGFIVRFLVTTYGLEKFKRLWNEGFSGFATIYCFSTRVLEQRLTKYALDLYKACPIVDWPLLSKKGCG